MRKAVVKAKATMTDCPFESGEKIPIGLISRSKGGRLNDKGLGKGKTPVKRKKRAYVKISPKFEVYDGRFVIDIGIRTVSEANCFEPWRVKHGRHREQQTIVALSLGPLKGKVRLPCRIMLTRFAPDMLDKFDNLPMSFKYIVDAVCALITGEYRAGKADSDERITIACDQVESKAYGIRIEITF